MSQYQDEGVAVGVAETVHFSELLFTNFIIHILSMD
jgi:hypothetical protein